MQSTYQNLGSSILNNLRTARLEGLTTGKDVGIIEEYSLCLKEKINNINNNSNSKEVSLEM